MKKTAPKGKLIVKKQVVKSFTIQSGVRTGMRTCGPTCIVSK